MKQTSLRKNLLNNLSYNAVHKKGKLMHTIKKTADYMDGGFYVRDALPLCDSVSLKDIPEYAQEYQLSCDIPNNYYTNINGDTFLVDSLKLNAIQKNIHYRKAENILITAGAYNAFSAVCHALCDPNDVILTFSPTYILFATCVQSYGAELVLVPSERKDTKFSVSPQLLEEKIIETLQQNKKIKGILIVNPTNVDGSFWTEDEINAIAPILQKYNILIIEDRVYDDLFYDVQGKTPAFFANNSNLAQNVITIDSVSKRYGAIQWRIGWMYGPEEIIRLARDYVVNSMWSPIGRFQRASGHMICAGLENTKEFPEDCDPKFPVFFEEAQKNYNQQVSYFSELNANYKVRRDLCMLIINGLESYKSMQLKRPSLTPVEYLTSTYKQEIAKHKIDLNGIFYLHTPIIPEAAMFLMFEVDQAIFDKMPQYLNDKDQIFTRLLYQETKVVLLPPPELTLPSGEKLYRLEFGVDLDLLLEGLKRIKDFMNILSKNSKDHIEQRIFSSIKTLPTEYQTSNNIIDKNNKKAA